MSGSNENDKKPFIDPFTPPQLGARRKTDNEFDPNRAVLADQKAFDPNRATKVEKTWGERAKDTTMALGNSGVSGGEAIVGLGNILSNGKVGKAVQDAGIDLKGAHDYYNSGKSLDTKVQTQRRQDTDSVTGKIGVLMDNPTQIFDTTVESVVPMVVGAGIGRGVHKGSLGKVGGVTAGAIGEGAAMAGGQAEQIRQENKSGLLENHQYDNILTTGALGAAIGLVGGKVAQRLGLEDVDTAFVNGHFSSQGTQSILGIANKTVKGALVEGLVEELPQTVVETILQNDALGRPWHEGLKDAAVMGVAAGMAMGGGTNAYSAGSQYVENRQNPQAGPQTGPQNPQGPQGPQTGPQNPQGPQGPQPGSPNLPTPSQNPQGPQPGSPNLPTPSQNPQGPQTGSPNLPTPSQNPQGPTVGAQNPLPVQSTPIVAPQINTPITNAAIVGANSGANSLPIAATPQNPVPVNGPLSQAANLALGIQAAQASNLPSASHAQEFLGAEQDISTPVSASLYGNTIDGFAQEVSDQPLLGNGSNISEMSQPINSPEVQAENDGNTTFGTDLAQEGADQTSQYTRNENGGIDAQPYLEPEVSPENAIRQGKPGEKYAAKEVVQTSTGRETTPFPEFKNGRGVVAKNAEAKVNKWLIENAHQEAVSRGDKFNARQFESTLGNMKNVSQADKDSAEMYLFDERSVQGNVPTKLEAEIDTPQKFTQDSVETGLSRMEETVGRVETIRQELRAENPDVFTPENDAVRETHGINNGRVKLIADSLAGSDRYELSDREFAKVKNNPNFKIEVDPNTEIPYVVGVKKPETGEWVGKEPEGETAELSEDDRKKILDKIRNTNHKITAKDLPRNTLNDGQIGEVIHDVNNAIWAYKKERDGLISASYIESLMQRSIKRAETRRAAKVKEGEVRARQLEEADVRRAEVVKNRHPDHNIDKVTDEFFKATGRKRTSPLEYGSARINGSDIVMKENDDNTYDLAFQTYETKRDGDKNSRWYTRTGGKPIAEKSVSVKLDHTLPSKDAFEKALNELENSNELGEGVIKAYVKAMREGVTMNDNWYPTPDIQAKAKPKTVAEIESEKAAAEVSEKERVKTETQERNKQLREQESAEDKAKAHLERMREKHGPDYDPNPELFRNFTDAKKKKTAKDTLQAVFNEIAEVAKAAKVTLGFTKTTGTMSLHKTGTRGYRASMRTNVTDKEIQVLWNDQNSTGYSPWAEVSYSDMEADTNKLRAAIFNVLSKHDQAFDDYFYKAETDRVANEKIAEATEEVNTAPTEAQIEVGNYKKAHINVTGLDITIENPKGSTRSGTDTNGKPWSHEMSHHYGYIKRTEGADGEHIDVYVGDQPESGKVYLVDQINQPDGAFDEHKVMLGFSNKPQAINAYKSNFDKGWKVGNVTEMTTDQFKNWLENGDTTQTAAIKTSVVTKVKSAKKGTPTNKGSKGSDNLTRAQYQAIHSGLVSEIQNAIKVAPKTQLVVPVLRVQKSQLNGKYEFTTMTYTGSPTMVSIGSAEDVLNNLPKGYKRTMLQQDDVANIEKIEKAIAEYKAENADKPLRQIFKTENGTTYNVSNTKEALERLLKKVKSSPGFKPAVAPRGSSAIAFGKISGLKDMLQDTSDTYAEYNAYNFAKSAEIPMIFYRVSSQPEVHVKFVTSEVESFEGHNLFMSVVNRSSKGITYSLTTEHGDNIQGGTSEKFIKTMWQQQISDLDKPSHAGSKETKRDAYKRALSRASERADGEPQDILQQTYEDQLNQRFNADGKLYSYAGMYSQTRNVGTLSVAADMLHEGASAETIRKETGWFKGIDGLWRYEINDSAAKLKVEGATFQDMLDVLFEVSGEPIFTIGDILDHPKLFEAYPHLKDVSLDYKDGLGAGYNHATRTVSIGSGVDASKIKSYLLHELQHAIQNLEGFSRGAAPSKFGRSAEENFSRYERVAGEVEARDVESRMNMTDNERTATQPYVSQGISDEDMIVVFNRKNSVLNTTKEVREKLVERFGEDVISALEKQGKLKIVDDIQGVDSRVEGFYEGGRVTLVASNLSSDQIIPTFLHELGGHAGFQGMMTDAQYEKLMAQFDKLVAEGDVLALRAKELAEREIDPEIQRLEMLPYLLTLAAQQSTTTNQSGVVKLISKLVSNVKAWAFDKLGLNLKLNGNDFVALAERMVKQAANPNTKLRAPTTQRLHSMQSFTQSVTNSLGTYFKGTPGHLSWWHKTLGSMYNLAERKPAFKPVFLQVQKFIDDIAYFSAVASEKAPTLLPRIDTLKDIAKAAITKDDNDAISKSIFEGTLYWGRDAQGTLVDTRDPLHKNNIAGVVFTDAELQATFNLNDAQIKLYREFRASTESSLDNLAKSEMLRITGKTGRPATDSVMAQDTLSDAYKELERHLYQEIAAIRATAQMVVQNGNFVVDPGAVARMVKIQDLVNDAKEIHDRTTNLKVHGYAPLMRFGKYSISVYDGQNLDHFGMYESRLEAESAYQSLKRVYQGNPNIRFERGTMSEQDFTQTMGVSMETAALFGEMLGLNQTGTSGADTAFQEYLRKSRSQRSALKRMIHRKGTDGYSVDVTRVLASFVLSNSRRISSNLNMPQINEHIQAIPKEEGQLRDSAIELKNFVVNPQEKGSALRSVMFAQYLGGSVSSALVNLTQTAAVTTPWLTQHTSFINANAQVIKARAELMGAALGLRPAQFSQNLLTAIKRAEEDGKLSPQEIFQLMEQAQGNQGLRSKDGTALGNTYATAANSMVRFSVMWGRMFGLAEQINRRVTFIAAYHIAEMEGMANPEEFARKAVDETQFVLSKASKMKWGRGNTGALLLTFKSYMVFYLELASRMWNAGAPGSAERKRGRMAVVYMAGMLVLMGGVGGLPFMEDLDDAIDGLGQLMGYNFSSKQARKEFLDTLPLGGFLDKGMSEFMPLDVSNRLGMGNLIPGTSLLTKKEDYSRDMMEIGGPAADFISRIFRGSRNILEGNFKEGILEPMPLAIRNAAKGVEMAHTDEYRNTKGEKVLSTTTGEALMKSIGFQPSSVAKVQDSNFQMQKEKSFYTMKVQEIRREWARGVYEKDTDMISEAREKMMDWNAKNPDQPIRADMRAIMKRVRDMRKTKSQKIADSAPQALRQRMRQDVNELNSEVATEDSL